MPPEKRSVFLGADHPSSDALPMANGTPEGRLEGEQPYEA